MLLRLSPDPGAVARSWPDLATPFSTRHDEYNRGRMGACVDGDAYLEIRDLFSTKWDPAVLAALDEAPCRFVALVRWMRSHVDTEILDGTVSRSLDRLQELGYVQANPRSDGEREISVYELTVDGPRACRVSSDHRCIPTGPTTPLADWPGARPRCGVYVHAARSTHR
jgi:DNA-binding HxlR family transcriptional regulator